ncbi:AAEL001594-PA [Aedes aegypti]|uniref:AAEL001594-PA n=2 Tax=Aedes aegypti TaxID=7159 RepID=A0A1S4EZD6_AEDAE|nr:zinc finger protein 664 [Aedes aegypti]EAT47284.1 AAEL001594-PA [Aedes aegypti]
MSSAVDSAVVVGGSVFFGTDDGIGGEKDFLELDIPAVDGESAIWKKVFDEDLMEGVDDGDQFVDFLLLEDGIMLDLVQGENEQDQVQCTPTHEGNEIDSSKNALRNGNAMRRHSKETPIESADVEERQRKDETGNNVASKCSAFKCGVCLLRFKLKAHLIRHMLLRHRQDAAIKQAEKIYSRCLRCNELYFTTFDLESHLKEKHKTTLPCDICLRLFEDEKSLNRHRVYHVGVNPFTCDVCNKQCKNSSHLHFHRRSHFTADLGYGCPHCQRRFSSSGNRQKHIARVHTQDKRYKCSNCQDSFVYSRQLKIHLQQCPVKRGTHSCPDCNIPFATNQQLAKHRESSHYQKDRPHACDQCPSRFKQLGHLKTHKLTHSGLKPFVCDHCEKRFRTGTDLKVHQRAAHTQEKPFRCEQCDQRFIVGYLLNQHRLKMHCDRNAKK